MIGALVVMTVIALAAAAVVNLSGTDITSGGSDKHGKQAEAIVNACLQASLNNLNNGQPVGVVDMPFAQGKYTAISDPTSSLITCTASVVDAEKTRSINADYAKNCVDLKVTDIIVDPNNPNQIHDITLEKNCNKQAIVKDIILSWNWSQCAVGKDCDGQDIVMNPPDDDDDIGDDDDNEVQYEDVGDPPHGKFWICHLPNEDPTKAITLAVNWNGWINGHKAGKGDNHNADYLGPCIITPEEDDNPIGGDDDENENENEEQQMTCAATGEGIAAVANCENFDGNAVTNYITIADNVIFEPGHTPTNESQATQSGSVTDCTDAVMIENGTYRLNAGFSADVPVGAWFTITTEFLDGSSLSDVVKVGVIPQPDEVAGEGDDPDDTPHELGFDVVDNVVIVDPNYQVDLEAIGSAITCGAGGPSIKVRSELCINGNCQQLWGYTDINGGETFTTINSIANSEYTVRANAYLAACYNFSQTYTSTDSAQVKVLKNLDPVPNLEGFGGQQSVADFLANYVNDQGQVVLNDNQVIFLFELGVNFAQNPGSTAADFQDLVLVMTITELL